MDDPLVETTRRLFEHFSRRDVPELLALCDPEVEFLPVTAMVAADGEPYRGHDGISRYMGDIGRVWEELTVEPLEFHRSGDDTVVAVGRVTEGHPTIWSRLPRNPPLDPPNLDRNVLIVPTTAGDDGTLARAALATEPDGVIIGTLGAGHLSPDVLELWGEAAERIPVVAYCRPERGVILSATYGYPGSERDLRVTAVIPAGFLSPQAARMKLLACLAAGLSIEEIRWAFRQDDG